MSKISASTTVTLNCAAPTNCGQSVAAPAYVDPQTQEAKPLQTYPYICLACWRAGWRDAPIGIVNVNEEKS